MTVCRWRGSDVDGSEIRDLGDGCSVTKAACDGMSVAELDVDGSEIRDMGDRCLLSGILGYAVAGFRGDMLSSSATCILVYKYTSVIGVNICPRSEQGVRVNITCCGYRFSLTTEGQPDNPAGHCIRASQSHYLIASRRGVISACLVSPTI